MGGRDGVSSIAICYGWECPELKPFWGEILHTHRNWPQGLTNLLYNGYWHSSQGVMHLGCGTDHLPYSGTEVKEKVQLYVNPLSLCLQGKL